MPAYAVPHTPPSAPKKHAGTPKKHAGAPKKPFTSLSRLDPLERRMYESSLRADPPTPLSARRTVHFESLEHIRKNLFGNLPRPDPDDFDDMEYRDLLHSWLSYTPYN